MPGHPQEKYAPGELDRTRKNLGSLSQDEARRMTEILGGEIGTERSSSDIDRKYERMKELNRRRSDSPIAPPVQIFPNRRDIHEAFQHIPRTLAPVVKTRKGYITRVRLAFLASRPEHRLLRRFDAWILLLFPYLNLRICMNPAFIKTGDLAFYDHIEHFVLSVRSLLARNRRYAIYRIKPGYFKTILYAYRNWNIEGIHVELSRLQARPRGTEIDSTRNLFRELFKPFMMLSNLEAQIETEKALKHLFDLTLLSVPKNGKEAGIIKELYISAKNEIYYITQAIPRQCWPILLYHTDSGYHEFEEFLSLRKEELLSFLGIKEEDILTPPQPTDISETAEEAVHQEENPEPEEEYADLQETACNRGLSILAELFPNSGWDCAETWPDLIPYFKSVCNLPKGADILSPEDPIHQIAVLTALAAELFSSFRNMKFEQITGDESWSPEEELERITGSWHLLMEELLTKHYILPLTEYCRQFERDPDFTKTPFAQKINSELSWIKRYYLTPFSYTGAFKGSRPLIQKKLPKLFEAVSELAGTLSRIILAAEDSSDGLLKNPNAPFHFEVPGYIPLRVKAILQRRNEAASNINLMKIIHGIISVLDFLVNNADSWFYGCENEILFRSDYLHGSAPLYSVDPLDTSGIIRIADEQEKSSQEILEPPPLGGLPEAKAFLDLAIGRVEDNHQLSAIVFRMRKKPEQGETEILGNYLQHQIREHIDGTFIVKEGLLLLILPETTGDDACSLALRLIEGIKDNSEGLYNPAAGISVYRRSSTAKAFIEAGVNAAGRALGSQECSIIRYRPDEDRYEAFSQAPESSETS